jgi:hypothetical protein
MTQQNLEKKQAPRAMAGAQSAEERNREAAARRVLLREGVDWIEDRRGRPNRPRRGDLVRPG